MEDRNLYNNPSGKPYCCKEGCIADATKEIRFSSDLEDYTHSCDEHVEELSEGKEVIVSPIEETF